MLFVLTKVEEPASLTNAVYEACLRYTVLARLAPAWNQVDRYLVYGRDFLLSSAPLDAVKMDIVINGKQGIVSCCSYLHVACSIR